jgi:peptidoglycan/xylan/chitin deacetylase (PgdA/CDA1 family)
MSRTVDSWGPDGRRAAVSVTFDNLGEAREVGAGLWPEGIAYGSHPSVRQALPRVLSMLDELGVRATFFVEGWNLDVYPEAVRQIAGAGHDLGLHGWVHESWGSLTAAEETAVLDRSIGAARRHGLAFGGFRPPGGVLNAATLELLRERGLEYCSPLGDAVTLSSDVAVLPFAWSVVDGYHYLEELTELRRRQGDPARTASPDECETALRRALRAVVGKGGYAAVTFHPFLTLDPPAHAAAERVIAETAASGDVWCAPCSQIAAWVRSRPDDFAGEPVLGSATWT